MFIKSAKRMDIFEPAIFFDLKLAAQKKRETGTEIIDLSLGSPDLPPNKKVREALANASLKENMYGYTLTGLQSFNEAVSDYYRRRVHVTIDPETEVLQTMGSQEGLVHLPTAFCNEGDIVLTTNPAYVAYDAGIKLAGAIPYYMPLLPENNYLPNLQDVPEEVLEKTTLLILNLPGNPVPAMPHEQFFKEVIEVCKKHQILVLHDAAYSEYYFKGNKPFSFLAVEGAKEVGLEINSLSKSFSLAGARIAYFVGNKDAIHILKQLKSNLDYGVFAPIQEAAITALNHAEEITDQLRTVFKERHTVMTAGLQKLGWEITPSSGGMFVWAKYPFDMDAKTFTFYMIEQLGIVVVPGTSFGTEGEGYVRIALVQSVEKIKAALERLKTLQQEMEG